MLAYNHVLEVMSSFGSCNSSIVNLLSDVCKLEGEKCLTEKYALS